MKKLIFLLVLFLSSLPYSKEEKHTATFNKIVYIRSHFVYNANVGIGVSGLDGEDLLSLNHNTLPTNPTTNPKVGKKISIGKSYLSNSYIYPFDKNTKFKFKLQTSKSGLVKDNDTSKVLPHKLSVYHLKANNYDPIINLEVNQTSISKDFHLSEDSTLDLFIESEIPKENIKKLPDGRYSNTSYLSLVIYIP